MQTPMRIIFGRVLLVLGIFLVPSAALSARNLPDIENKPGLEDALNRLVEASRAFANIPPDGDNNAVRKLPDPFSSESAMANLQGEILVDGARFIDALNNGKCETAQSLVLNAYLARFPELADAFRADPSLTAWPSSPLARLNPDVFFCLEKREFVEAQARLDRSGLFAKPFPGWLAWLTDTGRNTSFEVFSRDVALAILEIRARLDYPPAMRFFVELGEERPEVLRLDPLTRLLLLLRLKIKNVVLPGHDDLIAAAQEVFPGYIRAFARCWAREQGLGELDAESLRLLAQGEKSSIVNECDRKDYLSGNQRETLPSAATPSEALIATIKAYALAQTADELSTLSPPFEDYPGFSADQALKGTALAEFHAAMRQGDCEAAVGLLLNDYLQRYPQIAPAFKIDDVFAKWRLDILEVTNPDVASCQYKRDFEQAQAALDRTGLQFPPYPGWDGMAASADRRPRVHKRNVALLYLEALVRRNFIPAIRYWMEVEVARPDILRLDPVQRLVYLYRLNTAGELLPEHDALIAGAEEYFSDDDLDTISCLSRWPWVSDFNSDYLDDPANIERCVQRQPQ
jgi:hypothetical protein